MAAASSSRDGWKYDVFINFRSKDTRRTFIGHLYNALAQKAIKTFIDAGYPYADDPDADDRYLLTNIQKSKISIVVFSENYASSTRCLKQLVHILARMDTEHLVVPIFYQVDPSRIRKLEGKFAEAFGRHVGDSKANFEEVLSWRTALTEAVNLSGWDSRDHKSDAKFIEAIVQDIFGKLLQFCKVNISYMGDTRKSFVSHLSKALYQKVVSTNSIVNGTDVDSLGEAIQQARISIVVFSKNYAASQWCLNELAVIMESRHKYPYPQPQILIPVFYDVNPSDVRKATGPFGKAFDRYERTYSDDMAKVERWRHALTEAANISGYDRNHCEDDARLIEEIVQHTRKKLRDGGSCKRVVEQVDEWFEEVTKRRSENGT